LFGTPSSNITFDLFYFKPMFCKLKYNINLFEIPEFRFDIYIKMNDKQYTLHNQSGIRIKELL